jgi:hypothetical protein
MPKNEKTNKVNDEKSVSVPVTKRNDEGINIPAPNMRYAQFSIRGTSHLSVNRVSAKVREDMTKKQELGGVSKSRTTRAPKDFQALFQAAQYRDKKDDWAGIHAACFRCAMISACRTVGFKMVLAKLAIFTVADGYDKYSGTPLVRIWGPEPELWIEPVRNASGVFDLRPRPRWNPGEWEMRPRLRWDADLFTLTDITNLLARVGMQVGIGEGRPDSSASAGIEYGLFEIADAVVEVAA